MDRATHPLDSLVFGSLHFDGELSRRDMSGTQQVKGRLFFAHANDVVYSKIDARNGAFGIVPETMPRVAFSSEYPIYEVNAATALPEYVKLFFRMGTFRERINSLISGASGRKRVEPSTLEDIEVPLPPLSTQRAIIAHWQATQAKLAATAKAADEHEAIIRRDFLAALGLAAVPAKLNSRCFALRWSETPRWSIEFLQRTAAQAISGQAAKWPVKPLGELAIGRTGSTPSTRNPAFWGGEILWVSPKDMKFDVITNTEDKLTPLAVEESSLSLVQGPSVLVVMRSGILQHSVPVAFTPLDVTINQDMRAFTVRENVPLDVRFLSIYLQTRTQALLELVKWGTTVQSMNTAELENFAVSLPPLAVQKKLVATVTAARDLIAAERAAAAKLATDTACEVEEMILGIRPVPMTIQKKD